MPWIRISGSVERFIENLKKRDFRKWLKDWILSGRGGLINPGKFPEWSKWMHILSSSNATYAGKRICDIFDRKQDQDCVDTVLRLLHEDPMMRTRVIRFHPEIVKSLLHHKLALVGIDAFNFDGFGTFGNKKDFPDILVHPNTYYSMVNYILHFGHERVEDTIRQITGKCADWLRLQDRGYLKEGYWADINIIDFDRLATNENYINPVQYPQGICCTFVNGTPVVRDGAHTEARPGKIIRRK